MEERIHRFEWPAEYVTRDKFEEARTSKYVYKNLELFCMHVDFTATDTGC